MQFEIWFSDLNPRAQEDLLRTFNIEDEGDMNWDISPIAIIGNENDL